MLPPTPYDILRSINMVYRTMFLGLIVFIVVTAIMTGEPDQPSLYSPDTTFMIKTLVYVLAIAIVPLSYIYPQKLISRINKGISLNEKLQAYRTALFIRFAAINTAGILVALGFLILADTSFMVLQAIIVVAIIIFKPTPYKIAADLELNDNEKNQLNQQL